MGSYLWARNVRPAATQRGQLDSALGTYQSRYIRQRRSHPHRVPAGFA